MTPTLLLAAALCTVPIDDGVARDECDCIEINRVFDGEGKQYLAQVCYWEWHRDKHRMVDWRLLKCEGQRPRWDYTRRVYVTRWMDGETEREVTAPTARESFTQVDVELKSREQWPVEKRRRLSGRWER